MSEPPSKRLRVIGVDNMDLAVLEPTVQFPKMKLEYPLAWKDESRALQTEIDASSFHSITT